MRKVALFALVISLVYSCGSNDRGELVGVKAKKKWFAEKPVGMTLIPEGSFTMGKQDANVMGTLNSPARTVTVKPFYMDETEITNNEYRAFVIWVRDSIVRTKLAEQAELVSGGSAANPSATGSSSSPTGIQLYAYKDTINATVYEKYMFENYADSIKPLNWEEDLIWDKADFPDVDYVEVMDSMMIKKEDAVDGIRTINTKLLKYRYSWVDVTAAARKGGARKDFIQKENPTYLSRYYSLGERF